ncbi:hypothetical protein ACHAWO_002793 [Cyclotella atomus]|uniref:HIT-type domain-containing protein n=1 Tax=Cyclotella atomus TaxID=382360 RepID=A0ABD3PPH3_9STRA
MSKPPPTCDICHNDIALYHCPRCGTSTCSLKCCQAHKTTTLQDGTSSTVCNGKRDRTKFCSLKGFNDAQLVSDYHFLEDVLKISEGSKRLYDGLASGSGSGSSARIMGSAKRTKNASGGTTVRAATANTLLTDITQQVPPHPLLQARSGGKGIIEVMANGLEENTEVTAAGEECKALKICSSPDDASPKPGQRKTNLAKVDPLVRQAEIKGIHLLRMPPGMSRRLSNTSKYNKKNDSILWKMELIFYSFNGTATKSADATKFTVESSMHDSASLAQELGKHLDILPGNSSTRSTLKSFVSVPRNTLLLFMKCLPCSSAAPKYYRLDPEATLAEVLNGKTIIEYPTVEVVIEGCKDLFPLMISEI